MGKLRNAILTVLGWETVSRLAGGKGSAISAEKEFSSNLH